MSNVLFLAHLPYALQPALQPHSRVKGEHVLCVCFLFHLLLLSGSLFPISLPPSGDHFHISNPTVNLISGMVSSWFGNR